MIGQPELLFLAKNVVPPVAFFIVAAWLIVSRRRPSSGSGSETNVAAVIGTIAFSAAAIWLLADLSASDGWMGNLQLICGLGAAGYAFSCLAYLIDRKLRPRSGASTGGDSALERARARRRESGQR